MHSEEPLSQADRNLIRTHAEELRDHVPAAVQEYSDLINAHLSVRKRPSSAKSSSLPCKAKTEVAMEDLEEEKTRLLKELCNQAETGATAEDLKEKRLTLMIKLGRIEREIQRRRNQ